MFAKLVVNMSDEPVVCQRLSTPWCAFLVYLPHDDEVKFRPLLVFAGASVLTG